MTAPRPITTCLWFDQQAEEAARHYCGIFPNSSIGTITHYTEVGVEHHGRPSGSVMTVSFELNGHPFVGLNGGPIFKFSEAVSFQISCANQREVDHYWERLGAGGDPAAQQCGWLKDRYGVSWQVVPQQLLDMLQHPDPAVVRRVGQAMFQMKKIDIATLQRAAG